MIAMLKAIGLGLLIAGALFVMFLALCALAAVMLSSQISQMEEKFKIRDEEVDEDDG